MIDSNVIPLVLHLIRCKTESLSEYTLEYATALLMNLSLRTKGKDVFERLAPQLNVVRELSEMMEHPNVQVRTHINGTLYSILTRKSIKDQAHAIGMHAILCYLVQTSDKQLQRQIEYILT